MFNDVRREDDIRLHSEKMRHYRSVYAGSERWNGSKSLSGKTVVVYGEQGLGDQIQYARYLWDLKALGPRVYFHCDPELNRFLEKVVPWADGFFEKMAATVPDHDYHIPSLSLPYLLRKSLDQGYYAEYTEPESTIREACGRKRGVGVVWEGNPDHTNNAERSCPLRHFEWLGGLNDVVVVSLQKTINDPKWLRGVGGDFEVISETYGDMLDTARTINAVDVVVSVDTSVAHAAAALGKRVFLLLSHEFDKRWLWEIYGSVRVFHQETPGDWAGVMSRVRAAIRRFDGDADRAHDREERGPVRLPVH